MIRFHGLRPVYPMVCMHIWASIGMCGDARACVGIDRLYPKVFL